MYDPSFRNILLSATSQVVLLNATDGHWVRANRYLPAFITEAIESKPYSLPLIPPQGRVDRVYDEVVPWDYIDANQHVNNARYVEMATKGLSPIQLKQMYLT